MLRVARILVAMRENCPNCSGTGRDSSSGFACYTCSGRGSVESPGAPEQRELRPQTSEQIAAAAQEKAEDEQRRIHEQKRYDALMEWQEFPHD